MNKLKISCISLVIRFNLLSLIYRNQLKPRIMKTEISTISLIARTITITLIVIGVIASASIDFQATLDFLKQ